MNADANDAKPQELIRFNTSMYGSLAANHALVFEAMQNELMIARGALGQALEREKGLKAQAEQAEKSRQVLAEERDAYRAEAEKLSKELNALRTKRRNHAKA